MLRLVLASLLALFLASPAAARDRLALVIGNAAYRHAPLLANPGNDARLMATTLASIGFKLVGGGPQIDLDKAAFDHVVRQFGREAAGAEIVLFYYSGHGLQVDGTNWLVPVDADPVDRKDLDFSLVSASVVLDQMNDPVNRLNLMILDACRNNPFGGRGLRGASRGLVVMDAPAGTVIAYATQPGAVAHDGNGPDSPYTTALAGALKQPGMDVFHLFNAVGLEVMRVTGNDQQPWQSSSPIAGNFVFGSPAASGASPPSTAAPAATAVPVPGHAAQGAALDGAQAARRGDEAYGRKDYVDAVRWYRAAADQGNAAGQASLGVFYVAGLGGLAQDDREAGRLFRLAADQGNATGQAYLGGLYATGRGGLAQDDREAARLFRLAADQGSAQGQSNLGLFYEQGRGGLPRDDGEATRLYRLAARGGDMFAQLKLRARGISW